MPLKKPSGLLRHVASMLYDSLLVFALLVLASVPFYLSQGGGEADVYNDQWHQTIWLIVPYIFFVGFWTTKGRTLGMQSWGLQLEDQHGRIPGPGRASIRFAAAIISGAAFGLGFLWQLVDKEKLTWHDRLSGTRLMHYPREKKRDSANASKGNKGDDKQDD